MQATLPLEPARVLPKLLAPSLAKQAKEQLRRRLLLLLQLLWAPRQPPQQPRRWPTEPRRTQGQQVPPHEQRVAPPQLMALMALLTLALPRAQAPPQQQQLRLLQLQLTLVRTLLQQLLPRLPRLPRLPKLPLPLALALAGRPLTRSQRAVGGTCHTPNTQSTPRWSFQTCTRCSSTACWGTARVPVRAPAVAPQKKLRDQTLAVATTGRTVCFWVCRQRGRL